MNCAKNHPEISFTQRRCPMCELIRITTGQLDILKKSVSDWERTSIENNKYWDDSRKEYVNQIEELNGKVRSLTHIIENPDGER